MAEIEETTKTILDIAKENFQRLTSIQRMGLLALLALGIAAIPVLMLMGREPDMSVLFSNLEDGDVQAIAGRLEAQQVPYSMVGNGNTIMVPNDRVHELRIQMAGEGLPEASGVGFEIFDRSNLGVGEYAQKINFRRALQGELSRTIGQMPGVQRARVHLVIPERRLFTSDREPSRAAVVITPKRGGTLNESQVQGVVHLVASSVEGLDPAQVTVVDSRGQVLSQPEQDGQVELSGSQLEMQRSLETDFERRVQTMLDQVLGPDMSVVRVSAMLDFRQVEVTEEQFDPDTQVVRSEQRSQEKVTGDDGPSGVPGTRSNVPNEEPADGRLGGKEAKRKSETVNYEVNRKVSKVIEPSGTLQRLSVAVLVDGTYKDVVNEESGETTSEYVPRSEEDMAKLVESIKKAVGFSEKRGDQIEVVNHQFKSATLDVEDQTTIHAVEDFLITWGGYLKPLVFLLLGLSVLLLVVKPLVKNLVTPPMALSDQPLPKGLPATVGELEAQEEVKAKVISPEQQAVTMAIENPQAAAFVIREWIKDETETAMSAIEAK
ncbi:flagellar basal-body MS-ring/collar protein FliF [Candidatus Nitronereus thalassa]|uniref:Flagellar M-ring protein n=1 Tax=Candidatus Nitronereus thalassa TaxID=3020898 RepID=A0ABU3K674_9BACT|nr:flagellar basal-body MS-ring/collar protein FliF [Candidatus Nitronereus thalassa]MDT7041920.1 flagellar basal-body MS-ring/collar protein FliF [Candidatus Nitronereus thalassa]